MAGRTAKQREQGVCAKGTHKWVDGQRGCKECISERQRAYREENREKRREQSLSYYNANREKVRERKRAWRESNREQQREYARVYYEANREKRLERSRAWHEANKDKARERNRAWRESNPERNRAKEARRRARKAEATTHVVSPKDLARLYQLPCAHARYGACDGPVHIDHIVPLSRGGSHAVGNLQALCARHNLAKGSKLEIEVRAAWLRDEHARGLCLGMEDLKVGQVA